MQKENKLGAKEIVSVVLNSLVVLMTIYGSILAFLGINFAGGKIYEPGVFLLKYFTVQSNLLAGAMSLCMLVFYILLAFNLIHEMPRIIYLLKFVFSVGVALTFITVAVYLAPIDSRGYFKLFTNCNLFYHFLTPVIFCLSFIAFEKRRDIKFVETLFGMIPMVLYAIYYTINVLTHLKDGKAVAFCGMEQPFEVKFRD